MTISMKHAGKASSIPKGLAISAAISMIITMGSSLLIAYFINREKITWEQAGYWIMGMLLTASFVGAKSAIVVVKRQKTAVSMMAGLLYWGLLLCITALFFGGNFSSVWETAGMILAGSVTAALITIPAGQKNRKKTRGYR